MYKRNNNNPQDSFFQLFSNNKNGNNNNNTKSAIVTVDIPIPYNERSGKETANIVYNLERFSMKFYFIREKT